MCFEAVMVVHSSKVGTTIIDRNANSCGCQ